MSSFCSNQLRGSLTAKVVSEEERLIAVGGKVNDMRIKFITGVLNHQPARHRVSCSQQVSPNSNGRCKHRSQLRKDDLMGQEIMTTTVPGEGTQIDGNPTGSRGTGKNVSSSKSEKVSKLQGIINNVKTTAFNVFYGAIALPNRHKYVASHYEVNLTPTIDNTASLFTTNTIGLALANTANNVIPLGGPEFARKVREAALAANAKFLVGVGNIDNLVNAFYWHMSMSRALYADLCTAWRCQQLVNAIDEDGVYVSPLLNNHVLGMRTVGWAANTYAKEVDANTFAINTTRQAYCYASPTSNGVWVNSVVTPILQATRLPQNMYLWIEEMFARIHFVSPSDFMASPRIVVFWPNSHELDTTGTYVNTKLYVGYESASTYRTNATITQLINHINVITVQLYNLVNQYPQLDIMFNLLGMGVSSFNFTRDLDAKTVPCDFSYDISKFIESTSVGMLIESLGYYYDDIRGIFGSTINRFDQLCIARDPGWKVSTLDTFQLKQKKVGTSNFEYKDRVISGESNYALCVYQIAPLNMSVFVKTSTNAQFLWTLPLELLQLYGGSYDVGFGGFTTTYYASTAADEVHAIMAQGGPVIGRQRIRVSTITNNANGLVPFSGLRYLDLKDYYVPAMEARAWSDALADALVC